LAFLLLSKIFSNPAAGFRLKLGAFLPLPAGEGWGEGENYRKPTATTYLKPLLIHKMKKDSATNSFRVFRVFCGLYSEKSEIVNYK
jgi:hypothetical protein